MTTRYEDPVQINILNATDATLGNLVIDGYSTVMIGGFTGTGEEVGKLLTILKSIVVTDYPEELV